MKITYNIFRFPTVNVKITNDTDINDESYNSFMNYWEDNYRHKRHFHLFMDLESLSIPNMKLCIDFMRRQREMKKQPIQYLDYSIVILNNSIIHNILNTIWRICPPLNTVYLVAEMNIALQLLGYINNPLFNNEYVNAFIECNNITKI